MTTTTFAYVGQELTLATTGVELEDVSNLVRIPKDGSRRILERINLARFPWAVSAARFAEEWDGDPAILWGAAGGSDFANDIRVALEAAEDGVGYLPYPPADNIPTFPSDVPVNQVPYLQRFQRNAAVSATTSR